MIDLKDYFDILFIKANCDHFQILNLIFINHSFLMILPYNRDDLSVVDQEKKLQKQEKRSMRQMSLIISLTMNFKINGIPKIPYFSNKRVYSK